METRNKHAIGNGFSTICPQILSAKLLIKQDHINLICLRVAEVQNDDKVGKGGLNLAAAGKSHVTRCH